MIGFAGSGRAGQLGTCPVAVSRVFGRGDFTSSAFLYDNDPHKIGQKHDGMVVEPIDSPA